MSNVPIPASEWAARICATWRESVHAILNVGKLLGEAKEALGLKAWEQMCEADLPFSTNTAYRLIGVASDPKLFAHVQILPPHWGTLHELTKLTQEQFDDMVSDGTINPEMERRDVSGRMKAERRATREQHLGIKQQSLPQQKFGVIVGDPEWRFEPWSRSSGMDRAADNHYPTSCTEVIASRDVPSIAADDCVLFLWATIPMLPHALLVMSTWGFDYKSHYVWEKDKIGLGYWNREIHELLLIGTRGKIVAPAPGTQRNSVIHGPRCEHSAKPESFLELIESWFPTLPKIELNRRGPARPGWKAWGNESAPAEVVETADVPSRAEMAGDEATASAAEIVDAGAVSFNEIPPAFRIGDPQCAWRSPLA